MKACKPFLLVVITLLLMVFLSGCIIIPLWKYYDIPAEEVASVQFYDLRNLEWSERSDFATTLEPAYTIPEEDKESFLDDFSKLKFSDTIVIALAAVDPSFNYGDWVVRINYSNGQYTFYSCAGYGANFDSEGTYLSSTHYSCDDEELENLVSKYYEIE